METEHKYKILEHGAVSMTHRVPNICNKQHYI